MKKYYYYWIAILVFAVDFVTKEIIKSQLAIGDVIHVIGKKFIIITSERNRGAVFNIVREQRLFFLIITFVIGLGIIWYLHRNRNSGRVLFLVGLGMVLGGATGNFLERALYGEVVDFLQFTFGSQPFPIFNLADSGICFGVVLILFDTLWSMKSSTKEPDKQMG